MDGLQERKRTYEVAKRALAIANRLGQPYKSRAMSLLNKHRNELRWHQLGGRSKRFTSDFETTVAGIPCGVVIASYISEYGSTWHDDYSDAEVEFDLLDMKGYPATWLEKKLTDADIRRIEDEAIELKQSQAEERRFGL